MSASHPSADAASIVGRLRDRGWTLATGESLTAGLVASTLADVPGASAVLRGGVVAYDPEVKAQLLAVPATALAAGVVSREVAEAMAAGARSSLGADVGVGTTGVAGPDPHGGEPVGSVWIAACIPGESRAEHLSLSGSRGEIREATVRAVWRLLGEMLDGAGGRE